MPFIYDDNAKRKKKKLTLPVPAAPAPARETWSDAGVGPTPYRPPAPARPLTFEEMHPAPLGQQLAAPVPGAPAATVEAERVRKEAQARLATPAAAGAPGLGQELMSEGQRIAEEAQRGLTEAEGRPGYYDERKIRTPGQRQVQDEMLGAAIISKDTVREQIIREEMAVSDMEEGKKQVADMAADPEAMRKVHEKMLVPGTMLQNPARLSTGEYQALQLAREKEAAAYRAGEPLRAAGAEAELAETRLAKAQRTPEEAARIKQQTADVYRKGMKAAEVAKAKKAVAAKAKAAGIKAAAKARKERRDPASVRAARINAKARVEEAAIDAAAKLGVRRIARKTKAYERRNVELDKKRTQLQKRQVAMRGRIDTYEGRIDSAVKESQYREEKELLTAEQVRAKNPRWVAAIKGAQDQWDKYKKQIEEIDAKIATNNSAIAVLGKKVAAPAAAPPTAIAPPAAGAAPRIPGRYEPGVGFIPDTAAPPAPPATAAPAAPLPKPTTPGQKITKDIAGMYLDKFGDRATAEAEAKKDGWVF